MSLTKDEIIEIINTFERYEKEYRARGFILIANDYLDAIRKYEDKLKCLLKP